ncbi:MAG: hypothetical protein IPO09_06640 [Anaeromyxobacter sp.]|nr:hypothetical protein [Anaeromyxobacter sp.]
MRLPSPLAALPLLLLACAGGPGPEDAPAPAAPAARRPVFATSGWVKPREARPGCVAGSLVVPAGLKGRRTLTAKIAVDVDGAVASVEDVSPVPEASGRLSAALEQAVRGCPFLPGRDPAGFPAYVWLLLDVPAAAAAR